MHDLSSCTCWSCQTAYLRLEAAEHERSLDTAIDDYIRELAEEQVPLTAAISIASVLHDVCAMANIPVPLAVLSALDHIRV